MPQGPDPEKHGLILIRTAQVIQTIAHYRIFIKICIGRNIEGFSCLFFIYDYFVLFAFFFAYLDLSD